MNTLVKQVFQADCKDLDIDKKLIQKIAIFKTHFINKNEDHIAFFGGHLLGVHKVRFTVGDENKWFDEILKSDEMQITPEIHALPNINPDYNISSDVFNLSCVWLTHAIYNSKKLTLAEKEQGMVDVLLVLHFRYITSRIVRHFPYLADPEIAEATYAKLSLKFSIKQHGTWLNVLVNRAYDIISPTSIHSKTIVRMDDDLAVVNMLNDTQGRIRDMVKNICDVFIQTHKAGTRISTSSDVSAYDGADILKDRINGLVSYKNYIAAVLGDKNAFIKDELIKVVLGIIKTTPERLFMDSLNWMSDEFGKSSRGVIDEFIEETLTHSFNYLAENKSILRNSINLNGLVFTLKGVYMSSRSTDPSLMKIREKAEQIVHLAVGKRNKNITASIRTSLMLYIICRTYTKQHYK